MDEKDYVTIPICEYKVLVCMEEKVDAVKRYVDANTYISTEDVLAILGIEKTKKEVSEYV